MQKRKVVYIISELERALAFEWVAKELQDSSIHLSFILINPGSSALETFIKDRGFIVYRVQFRSKLDWPKALLSTCRILRQINPDIVHCHLLQANIIGLTAAWLTRTPHRLYTRHHSSLHHVYHRKGVLWDKLANTLSTRIIAVSDIVREILIKWEGVVPEKVYLIPNGFNFSIFSNLSIFNLENFKERVRINGVGPVVGVVSRLTAWKGVQFIVPAFAKVLEHYPSAVLMLLNASGDYECHIKKKIIQHLPPESYRLIHFEQDMAAAYKAMDVFVHLPVDDHSEAFGQVYIEALASGVPMVCTLSGIAHGFIQDGYNAKVVPYKDVLACAKAILDLLTQPDNASVLADNGRKDVVRLFSIQEVVKQLEAIYAE